MTRKRKLLIFVAVLAVVVPISVNVFLNWRYKHNLGILITVGNTVCANWQSGTSITGREVENAAKEFEGAWKVVQDRFRKTASFQDYASLEATRNALNKAHAQWARYGHDTQANMREVVTSFSQFSLNMHKYQ